MSAGRASKDRIACVCLLRDSFVVLRVLPGQISWRRRQRNALHPSYATPRSGSPRRRFDRHGSCRLLGIFRAIGRSSIIPFADRNLLAPAKLGPSELLSPIPQTRLSRQIHGSMEGR